MFYRDIKFKTFVTGFIFYGSLNSFDRYLGRTNLTRIKIFRNSCFYGILFTFPFFVFEEMKKDIERKKLLIKNEKRY